MSAKPYRLYDDFAPFYDRDWSRSYLADARAGFEELLLPRLPARSRVLDLCCGSGRLAAWLGGRGFRVTGLDGSKAMLALARKNAPEAELLLADARDFSVEQPFEWVLSTFDSINHFQTLDEIRAVFRCVSGALVPGGLFCFDVNTVEGFEYAGDESYLSIEDGEVCFVKSVYDRAAGIGVSRVVVFRREGELYRRFESEIPEYFHPIRALSDALEDAGFEAPTTLDAAEDLGMPRAEGRLFLLARKKDPEDSQTPA